MEKQNFKVFIRNQETQEVKPINRKTYTVDEAIDKVIDKLESPWIYARYETIEYYKKI
jgi:hypothetical protein